MAGTIGPGALRNDEIAPEPMLNDASDFEYVTILNPFTVDFQVQVAQDVPVNMPMKLRAPTAMTQTERDVSAQYGLGLKNGDHQGRQQIFNTTTIPAGESRNFKGSEAQVVVRQIVNELLQREGKKRMMHDPVTRHEAEKRIIQRRGTMQDVMDKQLVTPAQQINDAINKSNEVSNEAFPGLERTTQSSAAGSTTVGDANPTPDKRTASHAK